jgi:hypothetical protein
MKPIVGDTRPLSTKSAKKGTAIVVAEIFNTVGCPIGSEIFQYR